MSATSARADYSIDADHDDLKAEFDGAFDWADGEFRADTAYCASDACTGSALYCCV